MKLASVTTFDQLLPWLANNLGWPVDEFEIAPETAYDDLTYEYEGTELGLKQEDVAHIREIRQLRPLVTNQPWGIFFVNFEDKKIPVGVLKRILGGLTLKKRESANRVEQKAWTLHDLLFISSFGRSGERELSFLHFAEENSGKNKTVLKELGWDHRDTQFKLDFIERTLKSHLFWPEDSTDANVWREQWSRAFTSAHGATIRTARELTRQLAGLASAIRGAANDVLEFENNNGPLTRIFHTFTKTVFHNLKPTDFADMYAQTICYGLLARQIERARHGLDTRSLSADDASLTQGVMQPFLKDLMETFLAIGGRKSSIDFNELGVNEVVELLQAADMTAVLLDFGNRNPHEDPVLHFYEHFLRDYDSIMREQRGVYYTPLPVVQFIVRSVHRVLQTDFGLPDGLADITTWGEMLTKRPGISLPEGVSLDTPFVQILDPATGTGTFLVEVIEQIETHLKNKWRKEGRGESEVDLKWNEYVPLHLLPRLNGFELMMAPYAIAHIKIGMKLQDTGYRPRADVAPRVRVYLTNTLEEPLGADNQSTMDFIADSLALESRGANQIKSSTPITVVLGNPPYSKISSNLFESAKRLIEPFRYVSGQRIVERGALAFEMAIQDDYVKFLGFAYKTLSKAQHGVLGFITNFRYLNSNYLRGLRDCFGQTFSGICITNLGGDAAQAPYISGPDENVFDIQQGVCTIVASTDAPRQVLYARILGDRAAKHRAINAGGLGYEQISPREPNFVFLPSSQSEYEYEFWTPLDKIFLQESGAVITSRDALTIDADPDRLLDRIREFSETGPEFNEFKERIGFSVKESWNVESCKAEIRQEGALRGRVKKITYRPFDDRNIYYLQSLLDTPSRPIAEMMHRLDNMVILTPKNKTTVEFTQVFASRCIAEKKAATHDRATQMFPMFRGSAFDANIPEPNMSAEFMRECILSDEDALSNEACRAAFFYIYAILHSPYYRKKYYSEFKESFPRIPSPGSPALFEELSSKGSELALCHTLDPGNNPDLSSQTRFVGREEPRVDRGYPQYENGKVMINASCWFEDVTPDVWSFEIGGYQVCEKWLKDRAGKGGKNPTPGQVLSADSILHYRRIVGALRETIRLMAEVDHVIARHGGWPHAFKSAPDCVATAAQ
jgi:hypothetical protein